MGGPPIFSTVSNIACATCWLAIAPIPAFSRKGGTVKVAFRLWNDASRAQSLEQLDEHLFRIHAPVETGLPQL